ncbi:MAG: methionyl-tRNA formyltransferase [Candidatus Aureabacteria bacterium]|nr:methionyl-tRNA formyltransferase [Candidatus Auribacterota bacterium]
MMKAVFMGSSEFACRVLTAVLERKTAFLTAAYVKHEAPRQRKKSACPVRKIALSAHIPVFSPQDFKDESTVLKLKSLAPDVVVVVDYGIILPQAVLDIPRHGCFNLHASLLPFYRGAAPIQRAIMNGEKTTGMTVMLMDAGLDTGDIIFQKKAEIKDEDDFFSLSDRLSQKGSEMIVDMLSDLQKGRTLPRTPQDDTLVTFAPKIRKEEGHIDWKEDAFLISRKIRALIKWPGCMSRMVLHGKTKLIKFIKAFPKKREENAVFQPGAVMETGKESLCIQAGQGTCLCVEELQVEGKRVVTSRDFINGFQVKEGDRFFWSDE